MNSPFLSLELRSEASVKRERFIRSQLAGMRDAGFSEAEIAREAALLRGGAEVIELINHICAGAGIK